MIGYDWRYDTRNMAWLLTVTRGDRYATVLIDPNPPSGWHHLSDMAMALREATKALS